MIYKINIYQFLYSLFLFLLLFSNLISRILNININILFYISWLILFTVSAKYSKNNSFLIVLASVFYFSLYILDPRIEVSYNLLSIKDVLIPMLSIFIGGFIFKRITNSFDILNKIFFIFILYGVIQEIAFYTLSLSSILPWDFNYIQEINYGNFFQEPLLRFFGTMNSFVEYQVVAVFLGLFLLLIKNRIIDKITLFLNFTLLIIFLILSMDRSPIMMFLVTIFIWAISFMRNKFFLFKLSILSIIIAIVLFLNLEFLEQNQYTGGAFIRIVNVVTFNLDNDPSVKERENVQWKLALDLAKSNPNGIGVGRVTPSSDIKNYVGPHNNYLLLCLGYGYMGLFLFIISILFLIIRLFKTKKYYRYFGFGMISAFLLMAYFNLPFTGKQGIVFFIIIGFLISQKQHLNKTSKIIQ